MAILCYEPGSKSVKEVSKIEFLPEGAVKVTTAAGEEITLKKFQWVVNGYKTGAVLVEPENGFLIHDQPQPVQPKEKKKKDKDQENAD